MKNRTILQRDGNINPIFNFRLRKVDQYLAKFKLFLCDQRTDLNHKSKHGNCKEKGWSYCTQCRESFRSRVCEFLEPDNPAKAWV
jgi:hypothetical protein